MTAIQPVRRDMLVFDYQQAGRKYPNSALFSRISDQLNATRDWLSLSEAAVAHDGNVINSFD